MSKVIAEFIGRLFLAVADFPAVDDHIVLIVSAVDEEGAKGEITEAHVWPPCRWKCCKKGSGMAYRNRTDKTTPHEHQDKRTQPWHSYIGVLRHAAQFRTWRS